MIERTVHAAGLRLERPLDRQKQRACLLSPFSSPCCIYSRVRIEAKRLAWRLMRFVGRARTAEERDEESQHRLPRALVAAQIREDLWQGLAAVGRGQPHQVDQHLDIRIIDLHHVERPQESAVCLKNRVSSCQVRDCQ